MRYKCIWLENTLMEIYVLINKRIGIKHGRQFYERREFAITEMNREIVQYLLFYSICCLVQIIIFLLFLCFGARESKRKYSSLNEEKEHYWLKSMRSSKVLEEDNCLFGLRFLMFGCVILVLGFFFIVVVYRENLINAELLDSDSLSQIFFSVIGLLVSVLTGLGLVLVNKKKFYLGIDAQDVVKNSYIPGAMANMYIAVVYLIIAYVFCNINFSDYFGVITELAKMIVIIAAGWAVGNLMVILQQMIQICLNVGRRELSVFGCFRRRIIDVVKLDDAQEITAINVEKITAYLLSRCIHGVENFACGIECLKGVNFYSILVDPYEQKCLKKLKFKVNIGTLIGIALFVSMETSALLLELSQVSSVLYDIIGIAIIIGTNFIIYIIGCTTKSWLLLFGPRYYFEFSYIKGKSKKEINKIIEPMILLRKGSTAVALVEDLLGFYKMLLYNKNSHKYTHNVIEQVISLNDEKYKNIRNTILLLLYYAEYEKVFLKLENEEKSRKSSEKKSFLDKSFVQKVNKKVKKKNVIDYEFLSHNIDFDKKTSVEYQLANAILKHVYREPRIDNGQIVPKELCNYRFEHFFEHISKL